MRAGIGALAATTALSSVTSSAWAKKVKAAALSDQDKADVARIETYLNGITTMRAKFQQVDAAGNIAFGMI